MEDSREDSIIYKTEYNGKNYRKELVFRGLTIYELVVVGGERKYIENNLEESLSFARFLKDTYGKSCINFVKDSPGPPVLFAIQTYIIDLIPREKDLLIIDGYALRLVHLIKYVRILIREFLPNRELINLISDLGKLGLKTLIYSYYDIPGTVKIPLGTILV